MRIIPAYDMLIDGKHCPQGVPVDVSGRVGGDLVNQRIAKAAPRTEVDSESEKKPDTEPETATAKHPAKETAAKRK